MDGIHLGVGEVKVSFDFCFYRSFFWSKRFTSGQRKYLVLCSGLGLRARGEHLSTP